MLTLNDGRSELWQWDTGRKLTVDADCSQVHFSNKVFGRSIDVDAVDGIVNIPDVLLQTDKELTALAFVGTAENGYTKISKVFKVNKRNKPANYVFTAPDQTTLGEILDRIEDLENRPSGDVSKEDIQNAVSDYLDKNPVSVEEKDPTVPEWAKRPEPPKVEFPKTLPNPNKLTFTGAVNAEYDGSKEVSVKIPEGGGGGINVTGAEVGQTIVVKSVDENGKPTEWECAGMPSSSPFAGDWGEPIKTFISEEEVQQISIELVDLGSENFNELLVCFVPAVSSTATDRFMPGEAWIGHAFGGSAVTANTTQWTKAHTNGAIFVSLFYASIMPNPAPIHANTEYLVTNWFADGVGSPLKNTAYRTRERFFKVGFRVPDGHFFGVGTKIMIWGR